MTDQERETLRRLQDRFLCQPKVRRWKERKGENAPLWPGGPTIAQLEAFIFPVHEDTIRNLLSM